eukprot:Nitzschia sp. Nitz4//scaffold97_size77645//26499//28011//NITZ4_005515-RA/size77645-augustus-gene-0.68-mRNA-1//1//CDS//3329560647//100//frame0
MSVDAPRRLFHRYRKSETNEKPKGSQSLAEVTNKFLAEMKFQSTFLRNRPPKPIAPLSTSEVHIGNRIGMGEFGLVLTVTRIALQKNMIDSEGTIWLQWDCSQFSGDDSVPPVPGAIQSELARSLFREKTRGSSTETTPSKSPKLRQKSLSTKYVVKKVRPDLYPKRKVEAAKDLTKEAMILSRLDHPNVVQLHATVGNPGSDAFMILMDRLDVSLTDDILTWHHELSESVASTTTGLSLFPWFQTSQAPPRKSERDVLSKRLLALHDVAQAMVYLHRNCILLRDLKPENVGRKLHGQYQLIDFGLAKELKVKDRVESRTSESSSSSMEVFLEDRYNITGLTGTPRVMSPEVMKCQPYGLSSDVYSFGVFMWEVFSGEKNRLSVAEIARGERPKLPVPGMPARLQSYASKCFGESSGRPTFQMLCQEMQYQLLEIDDFSFQKCLDASQEKAQVVF